MEERRYNLLAEVVREFVRAAEPVGSHALSGVLGVSSATIRNDMAALEEEGFLAQPHTSAGRVPTLKGYQFYLDNLVKAQLPKPLEQRTFKALLQGGNDLEATTKNLARTLADATGEAVVVGFSQHDAYYTGLANLFSQPEFSEVDMVRAVGRAIDHLDEVVALLYRECRNLKKDVEVRIGSENPLGQDCALIFTSYTNPRGMNLLALLGPVRMDYDTNIGRLQYVRSLYN